MRRLLRAFTAFAFAVLADPTAAAEITRVASSGERGNPFDLDLSVRWERLQQRATITKEGAPDELRYVRTRNQIVPRVAVGLWHDLELHVEMPYVFADDRSWRFGIVNGKPSGGVPGSSSEIESTPVDPDGLATTPHALFAVAPETTVYHGGRTGDLEVGLSWGIFDDREDETKPFWLVGVDVTFPTAERYDPAAKRAAPTAAAPWRSAFTDAADPGPFGEKVWRWDVYTALSRRMGPLEPYARAHATKLLATSSTYSNCDSVEALASAGQVNSLAVANCKTFGDDAGAKLPWIAGLTLGTEIIPFENRHESQRVALDLRVFADYTSPHRFYNELTDATGKLHQTGEYLTMGGLAGLYLRASEYISLQATASLSTRTAHYLTGESLGRDGTSPAVGADGLTVDPAAMNPNFDWRYDAPGRRFRVSEVSVFEVAVAGVLQF